MSATISADGAYRYRLDRAVDVRARLDLNAEAIDERRVCFVLLNPSKADAEKDDATVRRCRGFAERWDCTVFTIVNLFALRSTNPDVLLRHPSPVSEPSQPNRANEMIALAVAGAHMNVVAWGDHEARERMEPVPMSMPREVRVWEMIRMASGRGVYCLGRCKSGAPFHPVRLPYDRALLQSWEPVG